MSPNDSDASRPRMKSMDLAQSDFVEPIIKVRKSTDMIIDSKPLAASSIPQSVNKRALNRCNSEMNFEKLKNNDDLSSDSSNPIIAPERVAGASIFATYGILFDHRPSRTFLTAESSLAFKSGNIILQAVLEKKDEFLKDGIRASNREWSPYWIVLKQNTLILYPRPKSKSMQKSFADLFSGSKSTSSEMLNSMSSLALENAEIIFMTALSRVSEATEYQKKKRKNVLRVMPDGYRSFLLTAKSLADMAMWIDSIRTVLT